ncbi:hypothetical protein [Streptomyces sp. Wh19]|uniref:hypothetical protein n=1 Tax=Streptomyces sp. Wh19 TaxID=3076629 RepID=UPI0029585987|nr:hypothetical protein [Streptomyces sp. Wh19]MDV9194404.1 hypothetical protein [Streptomyces sp. Wh19]
MEPTDDQLQAKQHGVIGGTRPPLDLVSGVLDEVAHRGQWPGLLVGELRQDGRQLCRGSG